MTYTWKVVACIAMGILIIIFPKYMRKYIIGEKPVDKFVIISNRVIGVFIVLMGIWELFRIYL